VERERERERGAHLSLCLASKMDSFVTNVESRLDRFSTYEKHVPVVSRFLLVATFFEDGLRMFWDWNLQMVFVGDKLGKTLATLFLICSALMQIAGGTMVVANSSKMDVAIYILLANIAMQAIIYGIFTDTVLMLRNLALVGGLLMLLSEKRLADGKREILHAPITSPSNPTRWLQLGGRVLLVLLIVAHLPMSPSDFTVANLFMIIVSLVLLGMVVVGFKTKVSAVLLLVAVSVTNIVWNNFWILDYHHPERDYYQYFFFQTISILGGLMLLVTVGPGDLSLDEHNKKKF